MAAKAVLEIADGKLAGHRFEFDEHDTFLFGRDKQECHAAIPHDIYVSRHHFILEVNPPDAQLRDLGSLNGTIVNGTKHGGREEDESPQEGARRYHPAVALQPGDAICVGDTTMRFDVEIPRTPTVTNKSGDKRTPTVRQRVFLCQQCGENVADEVGPGRTGDYVCNACRKEIESDPMARLRGLIQAAAQDAQDAARPEIPGYRIGEKLGEGGMGVVYAAECLKTGAPAAVKVMLSKVAVDDGARKMFLRECEVLGHLQHPNIVSLLTTGSSGSAFYCVTEYCNGGSLSDLLRKRGSLTIRKSCLLIIQALKGLEFAHEHGFVHRDVKPQNILLHKSDGKWNAKMGDFGLAKNFEKAGFSGMTATGDFAGTYHFMPREQLTDFKKAQPVSDIWSVGASLYYLLTQNYPRDFDDDRHPTDVILEGSIVPVRQRIPEIPHPLAQVVDRSIADDADERFQAAGELRRALSSAISSLNS